MLLTPSIDLVIGLCMRQMHGDVQFSYQLRKQRVVLQLKKLRNLRVPARGWLRPADSFCIYKRLGWHCVYRYVSSTSQSMPREWSEYMRIWNHVS